MDADLTKESNAGWGAHAGPLGPHISVSWEPARVIADWTTLGCRPGQNSPGPASEPVSTGVVCPPSSGGCWGLRRSAELATGLTHEHSHRVSVFLPPRSQGGPAHWTSAHPQWLLHHQRAGQERCVCIWAAPKVWEAEDQSGQGRGMCHPFSHMTFLLQDSTHYPRSGALFGLQHAILKQIVALPQKTMHFSQVERKARLMRGLRGSGQSSGHCSLLLPCRVLSQGCSAQSGELCTPPPHPLRSTA